MRQNRRELLFAAAVLCSAVCAWAETKLPVITVVPFEAAGVSQEDADAFTAGLRKRWRQAGRPPQQTAAAWTHCLLGRGLSLPT